MLAGDSPTPSLARVAGVLGLALACVACAPSGSKAGESQGASESVDARTDAEATPSSARMPSSSLAATSSPGSLAPVAVVALDASEARPCERLCLNVGDCLFADEGYSDRAAAGLELECLDLCVHAPAEAPERASFLRCEQRSSCGELTTCVGDLWEPLRASHAPRETAAVEALTNGCESACTWLYYCLFTGQAPGEFGLEQSMQEGLDSCVKNCEDLGPAEQEEMGRMLPCLYDECTKDATVCLR